MAHADENLDVAILYEIINVSSQASDIHNLPFRAIFAAYDEVLRKHGISSAHDQLYLRFLFRLGERLGGGGGGKQDGNGGEEEKDLFTEFEALLLELGIKLEIGSSATGSIFAEDDAGEVSVYHENTEEGESEYAFTAEQTPSARRRERRASFSAVLDFAKEASKAGRDLPESPASISRLQDTSDGFGSRPFREKQRRTSYNEAFLDKPRSAIGRSRLEDKVQISDEQFRHVMYGHEGDFREHLRAKDIDNRVVAQGRPGNPVADFHIYQDSSDKNVLPQRVMDKLPDKRALKQQELLRAKMQQNAELFEHFCFQKLIRNLFRKWHVAIRQKQHQRDQLFLVAVQYDRRELLRQAWNELLHKYKEKKQAAELRKRAEEAKRQATEQEHYLIWREQNAVKARDIYLVAKAFSHWANYASERTQENAVARQHILRLRYFNAWKEVTAVNELKIRRAILKRFLTTWHKKLQDIAVYQSQTSAVHKRNLIRAIYLNWLRHFCERRAPVWRSGMLAQKYFLKWVIAVRVRVEQRLQVVKDRQKHIQRLQLRCFLNGAQQNRALEKEADSFRDKKLASKAFSDWKRASISVSIVCQVSRIVNRRIASTAFAKLKHRHATGQQAQEIDRKRLLQRVWTTWNDNLRIQTMQHQINDRLVMRILYNWVLVERGTLMKRVHDERLQKQVLCKLLKQKEFSYNHSMKAEKQACQLREQNLEKMVWKLWLKKYDQSKVLTDTANRTYQPRVKSQIMHQWHSAHGYLVQISRWSVEATFYLRGQRSIKKWQAAAKESQSQKRREAYAVVKRAYHKNLAMRAFQEWKYRSSQVKLIQSIEEEFRGRRTENILLTAIKHWTQRAADHTSTFSQAAAYDSNKLAAHTLANWTSRAEVISGNVAISATFYNSCVQKNAYDSLRRLQLKIFELQSHDATALSVLAWTSKRRARGLLRAWAERAASRHLNKSLRDYNDQDTALLDSGPILPHGTSLISLARTPRTHRRNQIIQLPPQTQPEQQPFLPPRTPFYSLTNTLPNHLSTPSHRAARAKALSQAQTQTPFPLRPFTKTIPDHSSQDPPTRTTTTTNTSPPSEESSQHHNTITTNTSSPITQHSESRTTTHDEQQQPALNHPAETIPPRLFPQRTPPLLLQTASAQFLPATDIQPQRRGRYIRQQQQQTGILPAQGRENIPPLPPPPPPLLSSVGPSSVRRSLFPNARQVV